METLDTQLPRITKTKRGFTCRYGNMYGKGSTAKEAFSELLKEIFGLQHHIKSARKTVAAQEKRAKDLEAQNQKLQNALSNLEAKRVRDLATAEDKHYRELWEVRCAADQQQAEVAHINELRIQNHALLMENKALKNQVNQTEKP